MRIKVTEDRTVIKADNKRGKKIAAGILAVVFLAAGFLVLRCNTAETFPKGAYINGVDVSGLTTEEAKDTILKGMNTIKVKMDDNDAVKVKTKFEYGIDDTLETKLRLASVDPRQLGGTIAYDVPLTISSGTEETGKVLKKKLPVKDDVVETKDAYIDLDKMEIVDEVYGDSLDYELIATEIASKREANPSMTVFTFDSKDFIAVPKVRNVDLRKELKFDKHYLAPGMKLTVEGGGEWDISPKRLARVIKYTERGPEYDMDGAKWIAKKLAKEFHRDFLIVPTKEGNKRVVNYVLEDKVDVDKTAESIFEAAQSGDKGKLYLSKNAHDAINTRVEVSIASQTVYFIKDGKVKLKTPVVTGKNSSPTYVGIFQLYYKQRDVVLKGPNGDGTDYESPVSFWMPFDGGIGLHDATWRGTFGGDIYKYGGSHGCVNMPYDQAAKLYDLVDAGTVVVVYD